MYEAVYYISAEIYQDECKQAVYSTIYTIRKGIWNLVFVTSRPKFVSEKNKTRSRTRSWASYEYIHLQSKQIFSIRYF
jgi:hypothetical protein